MEASLHFDDMEELKLALQAPNMAEALMFILNKLHGMEKNPGISVEEAAGISAARDVVSMAIDEFEVDLS